MNLFDEFLSATEKCTEQCLLMTGHEEEKRKALLTGDEKRMEAALQVLQADIMKLELLEKRRGEAQERLGFESRNADELLEKLTIKEDRERFAEAIGKLRTAADRLQLYNSKAMELARANLQFIEAVERSNKTVESPETYRPGQAGRAERTGSSFQTKI